MSQVLDMVNQIVETDRMGLEEPLPPLKPITTQADIGCDQRSVREGLKRSNFRSYVVSSAEYDDGNYSNSWRLCIVTQVEELKILIRMFPIWATGIVFSVVYAQMSTMFVEQGMAMDTTIGSFTLPADTLSNFDVINVIFWVPVYDKLIVPMARKFTGDKVVIEQGEAEKEIGLDHGCLLLPRTTNGNTIVVPVVGVNHVVKVKLSYPFKQVQIAIEAVTSYARRPPAEEKTDYEAKNYLFDELQNAFVKLNDVKDDSINR
ncbi:peptide transporter 1 [Tanacetum coccineum]